MYREWKKIEFPTMYYMYMNLETTRLRGRPRNGWQDEVREDGRLPSLWKRMEGKVICKRRMEEAPVNGKESLHSAHANGMNEFQVFWNLTSLQ
jgi:hypothetical protein